jgi:nitrite reductase/ring-hydroxylating ferredoxin subunit
MAWTDLGELPGADGDELWEVLVGARHVGVAALAGGWVAFDPWCTHAECPLTDGWLEGTSLRCACHGALFDLETGVALQGPAERPLQLYPTRVAGGRLEAELG